MSSLTSSSLAVALLPDEPAGTIATRTAGSTEFRATLAWRRPEDVPPGPLLLEAPARCSLVETERAAARLLAGEVRALTQTELGSALEAVLRVVTEVAALTEATLEVGAVRTVPPRVASRRALEALACDLWEAGFPVWFRPSWTPAPEAGVHVAVGSDGGDLEEFLRSHPSWSVA